MAEVWRTMRPGTRVVVAVLALILGLNLLIAGVTVVTGGSGPGGPTSSSYATAGDGLAAYAELLARDGHPVERIRMSLDRADLDPGTTLVLADPGDVTAEEGQALAGFVAAGGRLIAAGRDVAPVLAGLPAGGPSWDDAGVRSARPIVPAPEVAGVAVVESAGDGSWAQAGGSVPLLGDGDRLLATVATLGAGRVVAVADASPLQNRLLARADNAAFGLAIAGGAGRPVAFAEAQHGYGRSSGLGAIPSRWRWAIAGGFLAAIVWMWSRGRRLGPPDDIERPLPPARRAYVDAMAGALARTRQPDVATAPLQERARRRLAAGAGLPAGATDDDLRRAAAQLRLPPEEIDALFRPARTDDDVVAVGRAVAHLSGAGS
jgi:hypothetical protein